MREGQRRPFAALYLATIGDAVGVLCSGDNRYRAYPSAAVRDAIVEFGFGLVTVFF